MSDDECTSKVTTGTILDGMGVHAHLEPGQQIVGAVVIFEIANIEQDDTAISVCASDGTNWITQRGLLEIARDSIKLGACSTERD